MLETKRKKMNFSRLNRSNTYVPNIRRIRSEIRSMLQKGFESFIDLLDSFNKNQTFDTLLTCCMIEVKTNKRKHLSSVFGT